MKTRKKAAKVDWSANARRMMAALATDLIGTKLSVRDLFALAALMGDNMNRSPGDLSTRCYLVADAMLKERARAVPGVAPVIVHTAVTPENT